MKCLVIGDCHLADKPPSVRTATYAEDILAKLRWLSLYARDNGCDFILQLGDIFHIKSPFRNSHWLVQSAHEALREGGLEVVLIAGNHDLMHDRLESIPSQPLGALAKMEGMTLLEGWHEKFPVYGVPYLADWNDLRDWLDAWNITLGNMHTLYGNVVPMVATHAPLFPPGQEPIYEYIDPADWANLQRTGSVSYGHIHDPHGTYVVGGVQFANFGAISRGSLHAETLKRKPQAAVYDFVSGTYDAIDVPHKPAEEVFRLEEHGQKVAKEKNLAAFLEGISTKTLEVTTIEKVLDDIAHMGLSEKTSATARELVEDAYAKH